MGLSCWCALALGSVSKHCQARARTSFSRAVRVGLEDGIVDVDIGFGEMWGVVGGGSLWMLGVDGGEE